MPACIRFTLVYSVRRTVGFAARPSTNTAECVHWEHIVTSYLSCSCSFRLCLLSYVSLRHSMQFASFLECFPVFFFSFSCSNADSLEKWCSKVYTSSFAANRTKPNPQSTSLKILCKFWIFVCLYCSGHFHFYYYYFSMFPFGFFTSFYDSRRLSFLSKTIEESTKTAAKYSKRAEQILFEVFTSFRHF